MPKNYYNITHWKAAVEILTAVPQTTSRELKQKLGVVNKAIAERIKTDFGAIQKHTVEKRLDDYRERYGDGKKKTRI